VYCNVLQCVAVGFSTLQRVCRSVWVVLQCVSVCCRVLQCIAVCHRLFHCVAASCSVLQCVFTSIRSYNETYMFLQRTKKYVIQLIMHSDVLCKHKHNKKCTYTYNQSYMIDYIHICMMNCIRIQYTICIFSVYNLHIFCIYTEYNLRIFCIYIHSTHQRHRSDSAHRFSSAFRLQLVSTTISTNSKLILIVDCLSSTDSLLLVVIIVY